MNAKLRCLLVGLVLAWAPAAASADLLQIKPPVNDDRWIGLLSQSVAECPPVKGWEAQKLLNPVPGLSEQAQKLRVELGLDRFCVYTRVKGWSSPFPESIPAGLVTANPDRIVVVPLAQEECTPASASTLGVMLRAQLQDTFLQQVGQVSFTPQKPKVRLAFVDTQPTEDNLPSRPGRSCHGYTLAHLANRLLCDGRQDCPIRIVTRLAMRYKSPAPTSASDAGGVLGSISDLAQAIDEEVKYWQSTEPTKRLVVNLSVGFDGDLLSARPEDVLKRGADVLAVHSAIRYADRLGALVIAAAGNRRGGSPSSTAPVLPAAWELRSPTAPVYAVGGLDWQDVPIPNSRMGGLPQRSAYADHAVVKVASREWTGIYTGTSVAAAVVSSVAAAVWQLQPELGPAGVMKWIDASAEVRESLATFHSEPSPPKIRRVSLYRALQTQCDKEPGLCSLSSPPSDHRPPDPLPLKRRLPSVHPASSPSPLCNPRTTWLVRDHESLASAMDPRERCPMELLPDLNTPTAGWAGQQPGDNPCPTCTILPDPPGRVATGEPSNYSLALEIIPPWQSSEISSANLVIHCSASDLTIELSRPSSAAASIPLSLPPLAGCTASIDWSARTTPGGELRSVQSPVHIILQH